MMILCSSRVVSSSLSSTPPRLDGAPPRSFLMHVMHKTHKTKHAKKSLLFIIFSARSLDCLQPFTVRRQHPVSLF